MRKGGLEPPRVLPHRILNPARLPIPPLSHTGNQGRTRYRVQRAAIVPELDPAAKRSCSAVNRASSSSAARSTSSDGSDGDRHLVAHPGTAEVAHDALSRTEPGEGSLATGSVSVR